MRKKIVEEEDIFSVSSFPISRFYLYPYVAIYDGKAIGITGSNDMRINITLLSK